MELLKMLQSMVHRHWTPSTASRNQVGILRFKFSWPLSCQCTTLWKQIRQGQRSCKSLQRTAQKQDLLSNRSLSSTDNVICEVLPFRPRVSANSFFSFSLHRNTPNQPAGQRPGNDSIETWTWSAGGIKGINHDGRYTVNHDENIHWHTSPICRSVHWSHQPGDLQPEPISPHLLRRELVDLSPERRIAIVPWDTTQLTGRQRFWHRDRRNNCDIRDIYQRIHSKRDRLKGLWTLDFCMSIMSIMSIARARWECNVLGLNGPSQGEDLQPAGRWHLVDGLRLDAGVWRSQFCKKIMIKWSQISCVYI